MEDTATEYFAGEGERAGSEPSAAGAVAGSANATKPIKSAFRRILQNTVFHVSRIATRRLREPVRETRTSDVHEFFTILSFSSSERGIARRRPTSSFAEKRLRPRVRYGRHSVHPRHKGD